MNAYKNSIREYGRPSRSLTALFFLTSFPTEEASGDRHGGNGRYYPPLDLRLEYLIDGTLLAHACTATANRCDAVHEILVRDAAAAARIAFVHSFPFSKTLARTSHFSKRALRCDRLVISSGIEKCEMAA